MKNNNFKKLISATLVITIIFSSFAFALPKKAEAQWVVTDPGNIVQSTITAANTTSSAFSQYSLQLKAFVLDTLATSLAKQVIRQITASVVNWINSGFEGSPSFITNPGAFFLDVADQITGEFLAKAGGPLTALCSPFSIDIRIALSFKYHPNIQKRYACTIGTIIKNSSNAIAGANINGFTAGDFKQGGWPAFVSLTTEPQNNPYGAYLTADSELSLRVANAQLQQKDELNQGGGFLSYKKCKDVDVIDPSSISGSDIPAGDSGDNGSNVVGSDYIGPINSPAGQVRKQKKCEIVTPGSVIMGAVEANVNGPLHELQLVDSINQIVNALFAQLVTQVLTKGLGAVSGNGPSDSSSYIYQIQNEKNGEIEQVSSTKAELLKNLSTYLDNAFKYKDNKDQSLNLALAAKSSYEAVKTCYANKISNNQPPLTQSQMSQAQDNINAIDSIITSNVTPLASRLLSEAQKADTRYQTLIDIKTRANAAKTVNELSAPSTEYSLMLQNRTLVSVIDISDSSQEFESVKTTTDTMRQDANRKLQECQLFPSYGLF